MGLNKRTKPIIFVYIIAIIMFIGAFIFFFVLNQTNSNITDEADMSDPVKNQNK